MLGTRGVRLGVIKPGPLRHAGAGAHGGRRRARHGRRASPIVEIMIPLTVTREEMPLARGWVEEAIAAVPRARARRASTSPSAP